jgi:hypothetical protein
MVSKTKPQAVLPPTVRAILGIGGAAEVVRILGNDLNVRTVERWLRSRRTPVSYIKRMSAASGIPVDEFLDYEEQRSQHNLQGAGGGRSVDSQHHGEEQESA